MTLIRNYIMSKRVKIIMTGMNIQKEKKEKHFFDEVTSLSNNSIELFS